MPDPTTEMIEAGLEYFYGVEPFCDRPANKREFEVALRAAFIRMCEVQERQQHE